MKSRRAIPIVCAGALLIVPSAINADSLWQKRTKSRAFMFYDQPYLDVGDPVIVLINQNTVVANSEDKKLSKKTKATQKLDFAGESGGGLAEQKSTAALDLDAESERSFDGSAESSIDNKFTDRITCLISEVLPNGSVRISGNREIVVDGNKRTLLVSGIVRRQDISPDGSVDSTYLAEPHIQYVGRGEHQSFVRQGWLGRGMNKLWPF